jgi:hypothetical protein
LDNPRRLARIRLGGPPATRQLKEFSNERPPEQARRRCSQRSGGRKIQTRYEFNPSRAKRD